jgi:short-subunit dehydrogenase
MLKLEKHLAIVTGATGAIGKACAIALASEGCTVHILGRQEEKLVELEKLIEAKGGKSRIFQIDLTNSNAIQAYVEQLSGSGTKVSILVHSAGVHHMGRMSETEATKMDELFAVNVKGPYQLSKELLPLMERNPGQIVFINSSAGLTTKAKIGLYSATKYALKALADSLRHEVNTLGIRVLSIYPGRTATEMQAKIHEKENRAYLPERLLQPEDIAETMIHSLKLPLTAEITDIQIRPFFKH